jgi:hypothetical protein
MFTVAPRLVSWSIALAAMINWARDLAMHVAATKPKALDASGVAAELIDSERRVATEKAREAGKPEAMIEKIVEGSVQKFLNEVTLLGQVFVKAEDGKQTIAQLLKSKACVSSRFHALRRWRRHRQAVERLRRRGGCAGGGCGAEVVNERQAEIENCPTQAKEPDADVRERTPIQTHSAQALR